MPKARTAGEITQMSMREAAIRLIAKDGYHGVSVRTLADEVGIQAASLYKHMENKQQFLFDLLRGIMEELIVEVSAKTEHIEGTLPKLCMFVASHVSFHARRQLEVYIGTMELRSLLPEHREVQLKLRSEHEMRLQDLIDAGIAEGVFHVSDRRITAFAILSMTTTLANWFRNGGRLSVLELQQLYVEMALRLLGAAPSTKELLSIGHMLAIREVNEISPSPLEPVQPARRSKSGSRRMHREEH